MSTNWETETKDVSFSIGNSFSGVVEDVGSSRKESLKAISNFSYGDDSVVAIDEKKMNLSINKLSMLKEKMIVLFNNLEEAIDDISYFDCSATQALDKQLNNISLNVPTIKNNLDSYIYDLEVVKKNFGKVNIKNIETLKKEEQKLPNLSAYIEKE